MAKKHNHDKKNGSLRLGDLPMDDLFKDKEDYLERQAHLQKQLMRIQQAYYHQGRRAVLAFEGWDAAGKGGAIRRLTELLDPRGYGVWPIAAPQPDEQGRHYLYRFWTKLPLPGTWAIFDRTWYGRVLVERVETLSAKSAWRRAYDEINAFEKMLVDDGVRVIKIFLHISADEQLERFRARLSNPYKRWKLTPSDIRSRAIRDDYTEAYEDMFARTSTDWAPWTVIGANRKWSARVTVMDTIIRGLEEGVEIEPPPLDPEVLITAERLLNDKDGREISEAIEAAGE